MCVCVGWEEEEQVQGERLALFYPPRLPSLGFVCLQLHTDKGKGKRKGNALGRPMHSPQFTLSSIDRLCSQRALHANGPFIVRQARTQADSTWEMVRVFHGPGAADRPARLSIHPSQAQAQASSPAASVSSL